MATTSELNVCDSCWGDRNRPVDQHRCGARVETIRCDCLCREARHSDLTTIDLDHDRYGLRDLTDPFGEE